MSSQIPEFLVGAIPEDDLCDIRDELHHDGNERQKTEIEKIRVQSYGEDIPFMFHWFVRKADVERSYDYAVYLSRDIQRKVVNNIVHGVYGRNIKRILGEKLYNKLINEVKKCTSEFEKNIRQDFTITAPPMRFQIQSYFISSKTKFPTKINLLIIRVYSGIYAEGYVSVYLDP